MTHLPCPVLRFPELDAIPGVRAAFLARCPGVDVDADRETALARLRAIHRETADAAGFAGMPFVTAEQVHSDGVAFVEAPSAGPIPGVDGLFTRTRGLCLAIYVADCAAVYLAAEDGGAIALLHSGRAGTRLNIVARGVRAMAEQCGCAPESLIANISPCIRPPHYEVDFAAEIFSQLRNAGVRKIHDAGDCTASDPEKFYSYRKEKGRTGRMLALAACRT